MNLSSESGATFVVTSFGAVPDSKRDATVPFQRALSAAKAAGGPVTLVIPAGRYDFFSSHVSRRECFMSNATEPDSDGVRKIAIDLSGIDNLTVEGNGARLMIRGMMTMLVAQHCHNLRIRNLEFDFARPSVSEMTAVEKGEGYWIAEVHPDSSYRIEDRRLVWQGEDCQRGHNLVQHYDPATKTVWRGGDPTSKATSIVDLGARRLRFEVPPDSLSQVVVGRTYQLRDTIRDESGMWFDRSRNVSLEDVTIRSMAGFGVLFQYTENVDLRRITVAPSPSSGRTCSAAADILHFSGCRGKIRVRDSVLTSAHDDAINIHGTHLRVVARIGERKIRVRFMHPQTWGFAAFAPGDEIEFVCKDTLLPFATGRVTKFEMTADPREQILTLAKPVPAELRLDSDAVENVTWTPSVEIRKCEIAQIPTRGILVTTRRPIRIIGNRFFRTQMPAILLEDDAAGWYESGPVHDLLIEKNAFFECRDDAVRIEPQNTVHAVAVHRNIRVLNNVIDLITATAVRAKSTSGLTVTGNRFRAASSGKLTLSDLIVTKDSTDVRIERNVIE